MALVVETTDKSGVVKQERFPAKPKLRVLRWIERELTHIEGLEQATALNELNVI
jgi:hypothetical protein